jgi:hypothetical protein
LGAGAAVTYTAPVGSVGANVQYSQGRQVLNPLTRISVIATAVLTLATGASAQRAERSWHVEGLAGAAVPTFDITDLAKTGGVVAGAVGYQATDRVLALLEFDWGKHGGKNGGPNIAVLHYMAKAGYAVYQTADGKLKVFVNAGVGAVSFDPDVSGADTNTYFAINAGAKAYYMLSPALSLVLSPQGDIAFVSKDDGFTGSTAWVWPFTVGLSVSF